MKILIRRWLDGYSNDTIALSKTRTTKSALERLGIDGMVIVFSKAENLYSHNTKLSVKEINKILKFPGVVALGESDIVLINI